MPRSSPFPRTLRLPLFALFCAVAALALTAPAAEAQPFVSWADFPGHPTHSYVNIPHHPSLNPTGAFTFEAWVKIANNVTGEDCRSIAGKNFLQAWWFGQCNVSGQPTLRRSEEHTSELQSPCKLVYRLQLGKKNGQVK